MMAVVCLAVAGAIDSVLGWFRRYWRMTARARLLMAFSLGLLTSQADFGLLSVGGVTVGSSLVALSALWYLSHLVAQRHVDESANAFAIRVAAEHGVTASLKETHTIVICDAPTWHRIAERGVTICAGAVEVDP